MSSSLPESLWNRALSFARRRVLEPTRALDAVTRIAFLQDRAGRRSPRRVRSARRLMMIGARTGRGRERGDHGVPLQNSKQRAQWGRRLRE